MMQYSENVSEGRVKYTALWKGTIADFIRQHPSTKEIYYKSVEQLAEALRLTERCGAAPVMEDGRVGGNVATRIVTDDTDVLVVSKSGRLHGQSMSSDDDFCVITEFDSVKWSLSYYGKDSLTLPTSDSPLHYSALHAAAKLHWDDTPFASLHGHALQTEDKARQLSIPCSLNETLFSTREDTDELISLLKQYPYPQHKIYVRKGHGFVILGKTAMETVDRFKTDVMPFID